MISQKEESSAVALALDSLRQRRKLIDDGIAALECLIAERTAPLAPAAAENNADKPDSGREKKHTSKAKNWCTVDQMTELLKSCPCGISTYKVREKLRDDLNITMSEDAVKALLAKMKGHLKVDEPEPGKWKLG
jgi:hypothetical protein